LNIIETKWVFKNK
jgi:hypothetical protein